MGGVSPDSRFVHTYAMHDAPITFGLDTPPALGRAAAEGLLAAHAANGGGGGRGNASVLPPPAPSATPPPSSSRHTGHLIASGPPPPSHAIAPGPSSPTLVSPDESPPRRGEGSVLTPPPLLGDDGGMATSLDAADDECARSGSPSGDDASAPAGKPARAAGGAATATATTTTRPWPLAAPKGTWLYDVTLAGASPASVRAALADPSFAARLLAARRCTDVDVGPWSPPASATTTTQSRTLRYTAPVAAGVLGGQRISCVEAQVVTPLGGASGPTRSPHRFTLTVTATTPDLPLYGGAFECEIVVTGDAAASEAASEDSPPTSTRVTAFGRVIFKKKLPMVLRMLDVNAVAGLKAAYGVHAAELASFLAAPSTAAAAPGGGGLSDAVAAIAARLAAGDATTLAAVVAAVLAVALAVALASVAAAVNGVRSELAAAARRDLAAIAVAAAKVAARQCK